VAGIEKNGIDPDVLERPAPKTGLNQSLGEADSAQLVLSKHPILHGTGT
jgi:hypothetical protein